MTHLTWLLVAAALLGLAALPYAGWPLLLWLFPRRRPEGPTPAPGPAARVSVIIPARQEGRVLARKLAATLALEPRVHEVLVGSDGSTDDTAPVARAVARRDPRVKVLDFPERRGKAAVLADLVAAAEGELLLLTDAGAKLDPGALPLLVAATGQPGVDAALARYQAGRAGGEGLYWRLQTALKAAEADRDLVVGAHGAAWLVRRTALPALPPGTINDDLVWPALLRASGGGLRYVPAALVREDGGDGPGVQFRRLARIARGNWQWLARHPGLLDPRRPRVAVPLLVTKVLRILGPVLLLGALGALSLAGPVVAGAAWAAALGGVALGAVALQRVAAGRRVPAVLALGGYALLGQAGTLKGLLDALAGKGGAIWDSAVALVLGDDLPPAVPLTVRAAKRAVDLIGAAVLLALTWPIMLVVAAAVRLGSPGPALYRQARVRHDGQGRPMIFEMLKFRTMRVDAEAASGPVWAQAEDPRITPVGRVLRKARLDELPQLWNVLRGDMSMVGPRPERPAFVAELEVAIPGYSDRVARCKPGITGWAQVNCDYDTSLDSVRRKVLFDLAYVAHLHGLGTWLRMEARIVASTVAVMVLGKGAR